MGLSPLTSFEELLMKKCKTPQGFLFIMQCIVFKFLNVCLETRQNGLEICRLLGKIDLLYNFETKYQKSKLIVYRP